MKAISIFTAGAFLYLVKVTAGNGNTVWLWAVSQFEDGSFYLGEPCNPIPRAETYEGLLLPDVEDEYMPAKPEHDTGTDKSVCEQCGSDDVEIRQWCDANTGRITDRGCGIDMEDCWCNCCGEHIYPVSEKEYLKNRTAEEQ